MYPCWRSMFIDDNFILTSSRNKPPDNLRLRIQFCRKSFLLFNECTITWSCLEFSLWTTFLKGGSASGLTDAPLSKWLGWSISSLILCSAVCSFVGGSFFTFGRMGACIQWVRGGWRIPKPWRGSDFCTFRNMFDV